MAMILASFQNRVSRFLRKKRFRPIRVFCLHQVVENDSSPLISEEDLVSSEDFRRIIGCLRERVIFISLAEAARKLKEDTFRFRDYVVLTFDDGYRSPLPILHWLEEQQIPFTVFLNAKYLDGVSYSSHIRQRIQDQHALAEGKVYLTEPDVEALSSDFCSIASHGYEHLDAISLSADQFSCQLEKNLQELKRMGKFVPFHAYTWGHHSKETDEIVYTRGLTPVLMDGQKNYSDSRMIHRELFSVLLDEMKL